MTIVRCFTSPLYRRVYHVRTNHCLVLTLFKFKWVGGSGWRANADTLCLSRTWAHGRVAQRKCKRLSATNMMFKLSTQLNPAWVYHGPRLSRLVSPRHGHLDDRAPDSAQAHVCCRTTRSRLFGGPFLDLSVAGRDPACFHLTDLCSTSTGKGKGAEGLESLRDSLHELDLFFPPSDGARATLHPLPRIVHALRVPRPSPRRLAGWPTYLFCYGGVPLCVFGRIAERLDWLKMDERRRRIPSSNLAIHLSRPAFLRVSGTVLIQQHSDPSNPTYSIITPSSTLGRGDPLSLSLLVVAETVIHHYSFLEIGG